MKTIKIPRIIDRENIEVRIIKSRSNHKILTLCAQTIEGVKIQRNHGIHIDFTVDNVNFNHLGDIATVPTKYVNKLLRYIYLENLRKNLNQ